MSATVTLGADSSALTTLQRDFADFAKDFKKHIDSLSKDSDKLRDSIVKGFAFRIGGGIFDGLRTGLTEALSLVPEAIKKAADMQQLQTSFDVLLGDGEKAKKLMGELKGFGAVTPFKMDTLAPAAKQLLAFNVAAEDIIPTLTMIGDLASGLNVPMDQLASVYGRVKTMGNLDGRHLKELTGAGIPIVAALAKQFDVAETSIHGMVEEGKVGFADLDAAMHSLTASGGQFSGMMAAQSQTWNGLMSTLQDNIAQAMGAFGKPVIDTLGPMLSGWVDESGGLIPIFEQIGEQVAEMTAGIQLFVAAAEGGFNGLKDVVGFVAKSLQFILGVNSESSEHALAKARGASTTPYTTFEDALALQSGMDKAERYASPARKRGSKYSGEYNASEVSKRVGSETDRAAELDKINKAREVELKARQKLSDDTKIGEMNKLPAVAPIKDNLRELDKAEQTVRMIATSQMDVVAATRAAEKAQAAHNREIREGAMKLEEMKKKLKTATEEDQKKVASGMRPEDKLAELKKERQAVIGVFDDENEMRDAAAAHEKERSDEHQAAASALYKSLERLVGINREIVETQEHITQKDEEANQKKAKALALYAAELDLLHAKIHASSAASDSARREQATIAETNRLLQRGLSLTDAQRLAREKTALAHAKDPMNKLRDYQINRKTNDLMMGGMSEKDARRQATVAVDEQRAALSEKMVKDEEHKQAVIAETEKLLEAVPTEKRGEARKGATEQAETLVTARDEEKKNLKYAELDEYNQGMARKKALTGKPGGEDALRILDRQKEFYDKYKDAGVTMSQAGSMAWQEHELEQQAKMADRPTIGAVSSMAEIGGGGGVENLASIATQQLDEHRLSNTLLQYLCDNAGLR